MLVQVATTLLVDPRDVKEFAEASLNLAQEPVNPAHSEQAPKVVIYLPHSVEGSIVAHSRGQLSSIVAAGVLILTESYFKCHHSVLPPSRQLASKFL